VSNHSAPDRVAYPAVAKAWGTTRRVHLDQGSEVWHASIVMGGHSSVHRHETKANKFVVQVGKLAVIVFEDDRRTVRHTIELTAGMATTIEAGVWHQFLAHVPVELIEIYWTDLGRSDIERETEGGVSP
jgi:mannose-6-phosphate isomerase-like protein (cupin superfamily)